MILIFFQKAIFFSLIIRLIIMILSSFLYIVALLHNSVLISNCIVVRLSQHLALAAILCFCFSLVSCSFTQVIVEDIKRHSISIVTHNKVFFRCRFSLLRFIIFIVAAVVLSLWRYSLFHSSIFVEMSQYFFVIFFVWIEKNFMQKKIHTNIFLLLHHWVWQRLFITQFFS